MPTKDTAESCLSKIDSALTILEHKFPKSVQAAHIELLLKSMRTDLQLDSRVEESGIDTSFFDVLVLTLLLMEKKVLSKDDIKSVLSASLLKDTLIKKCVLKYVDFDNMSLHCEDLIALVRAYYSSTLEDKHKVLKRITEIIDARVTLKIQNDRRI